MHNVKIASVLLDGDITGPDRIAFPFPGEALNDRTCEILLTDDNQLGYKLADSSSQSTGARLLDAHHFVERRLRNFLNNYHQASEILDAERWRACELWFESVDPRNTLAERYLHQQVGWFPHEAAEIAIHFHPGLRFGTERVPCMVALVRHALSDVPLGIYCTALTRSAARAKIGCRSHLTIGPTAGGVIKIGRYTQAETMLILGEGLESALGVQDPISSRCAWACLSAEDMSQFPELENIDLLLVAVTEETTNRTAAKSLAIRYVEAGRRVILAHPYVPMSRGSDAHAK